MNNPAIPGSVEGVAIYAALGFAGMAIGAVLAALLYFGGRRWIDACPPAARQRWLTALLLCPVIAALALMLSMSAPISLFSGNDLLAHCSAHPETHGALCQWHAPQIALPAWLTLTVLLLLGSVLLAGGYKIARLIAAKRRLRLMQHLADEQPDGRYFLLPMSEPLAFAAGLFRGHTYISKGLKRQLDESSLAIVLAHEDAHVRRHDMLATALINSLSRLHIPMIGKALRQTWQLAAEQSCDASVAKQTGDRLAVADCLICVARLQNQHRREMKISACHLIDSQLDARISALLNSPAPRGPAPAFSLLGVFSVALAALTLAGPTVHHWMEHLLPATGL
ncbi:M56 family metallopeptidase [Salinisphaera sp. P385]|uniref:M56 family metallopeptidase n=1 Tax=Spectribacter acetivorans TaxID=3075603 RepID=A0ABU3B4U1_9GAMM|nr:M56 family metallopeptidase [Salinisphaera sp. P385]MDT0617470.1 M56 family metallopeptidase [Salinisphaera sp. P385]